VVHKAHWRQGHIVIKVVLSSAEFLRSGGTSKQDRFRDELSFLRSIMVLVHVASPKVSYIWQLL